MSEQRNNILKELNNFEKFFVSTMDSLDCVDEVVSVYEKFLELKFNITDLISDEKIYNAEFNGYYGNYNTRFGGILVDLNTLPIGSCFNVENGHWCGQIIEEQDVFNNQKYLCLHNYYDPAYPTNSEHIIRKIKLDDEYPAVINYIKDFPYVYNIEQENTIDLE